MRGVLALGLTVGLIGTGALSSQAAPANYTEAYRFDSTGGASTGYSSHMSGDYAIFTYQRNLSVKIMHQLGADATQWEEQVIELPASVRGFGDTVRLNAAGDTAYIASPRENKIYVWNRTGANTWNEGTAIEAGTLDPRIRSHDNSFGEALVIDGDNLVVGAPMARVDGLQYSGVAYVINTVTGERTMLLPETPRAFMIFGQSLAVSGNRVAVSMVQNKDAQNQHIGGVHLFDLNTPTAAPLFRSQPMEDPRMCLNNVGSGPAFGMSLEFSDDSLYVGSPQETNYTADDRDDPLGGCNLSSLTDGTTTQGAIYRLDYNLNQIGAKIVPPAGERSFGYTIAAVGDAILANGSHGPDNTGEVFVYTRASLDAGIADENGRQHPEPVQIMTGSDSQPNDEFGTDMYGSAINVSGDRALIAAPAANGRQGAVYLFDPIIPAVNPSLALTDTAVIYGDTGTLTATAEQAPADATVVFTIDGAEQPAATPAAGVATLTLDPTALGVGDYAISAELRSAAGAALVPAVTAHLTITPAATTTTVVVDPETVIVGDPVTVTGSVAGEFGTIPTGPVVLVQGGNELETVELEADGSFTIQGEVAEVPATARTLQDMGIEVRYAGDANHAASSGQATLQVEGTPGVPAPLPEETDSKTDAEGKLVNTGADGVMLGVMIAFGAVLAGGVTLVTRRRNPARL
ncbi:Ig-like domain-containing protein [Mycetocola spongiae]|uniref:Ig-like domain-containing protein n=1 Tax=Mycetocola spongiae TaxID=2859226 RepID=UPI001CF26AC0|nr:Ig-like domain-containing protein [Mycetocola spongiae]UCR89484.1 Ig-like domain-containing protein [Mycetocola spongiae]